jgi:hypothetical protein
MRVLIAPKKKNFIKSRVWRERALTAERRTAMFPEPDELAAPFL